MLAVLFALASSLMYALASVLQQRGAEEQPEDQSLKLGLLVRLLQHPAWLIGLGCDVVGYVFQFVALGHGPIVVVQPLLVCGLLFALPIGAAWSKRSLHLHDWVGAVLVVIGLSVFLLIAHPASGRSNARVHVWVLLLVSDLALTIVLVVIGLTGGDRRKAVAFSGAAGIVYGAAAALTKTSSHLLDRGIVHVLVHWQPYVLVVAAVGGMLLVQSAFQAGSLDVSLPTMTVVDPIVSILIGAMAFHEAISNDALSVVLETAGLIAVTIGVVLLARVETAGLDEHHLKTSG